MAHSASVVVTICLIVTITDCGDSNNLVGPGDKGSSVPLVVGCTAIKVGGSTLTVSGCSDAVPSVEVRYDDFSATRDDAPVTGSFHLTCDGARVAAANISVQGHWEGTFATSLVSSASIELELTQQGTLITGTYFGDSDQGTVEGFLAGTLDGDAVDFILTQTNPECAGSFRGALSVSDRSMSFKLTGSDCLGEHKNGTGSAVYTERPTTGLSCGDDCNGTFCRSSGASISELCSDSDLEWPCLGTATGMYCSKTCVSDEDCVTPNLAMRCLTSCSEYPDRAGTCWSESDALFMAGVCR